MVLDIHGIPIDDVWAAEFRGFFFGEGSIEIYPVKHPNWKKDPIELRCRARIAQRDDNSPILREIQAKLGGCIGNHNRKSFYSPANGKVYESKATISWTILGVEKVQRVVDLLTESRLPHSKIGEAILVGEFLRLRPKTGIKYTVEQKAACLKLMYDLREFRKYS